MSNKDIEEFKKYYQDKRVTDTYDEQREKSEYRKRKRELELKYFLELLDKKDDEDVLELGCSSGFLTEKLGRVTAIDTSKNMLELTRKKNPLASTICADMFKLPFPKDSFDKVVTIRVWNHLKGEDLRKALKRVQKVLRRGGLLVFDVEEKNILRKIVAVIYQKITGITGYKIYQYSFNELYGILKDEGFFIIDFRYLNHRIGRQIIVKAWKPFKII